MTTPWKLQYRLYSLGCLLNGKLSINEPLRNEKSFPQKKQTHGFFFSDISFFNNTSTPTKSIEVKGSSYHNLQRSTESCSFWLCAAQFHDLWYSTGRCLKLHYQTAKLSRDSLTTVQKLFLTGEYHRTSFCHILKLLCIQGALKTLFFIFSFSQTTTVLKANLSPASKHKESIQNYGFLA